MYWFSPLKAVNQQESTRWQSARNAFIINCLPYIFPNILMWRGVQGLKTVTHFKWYIVFYFGFVSLSYCPHLSICPHIVLIKIGRCVASWWCWVETKTAQVQNSQEVLNELSSLYFWKQGCSETTVYCKAFYNLLKCTIMYYRQLL